MNLECPACHHELQTLELDNGKLTVDVCAGHCGGIWFDNRELQRVDEQSEAIGEQLLNIPRDPALKVDMTSKRRCPVCQNIKMMRHFFSVKRSIEVDECAGCGGIWLDANELARIRGEFVSADDREAAAEQLFATQFDEQLADMRKESQEQVERADRFARMFSWLSFGKR